MKATIYHPSQFLHENEIYDTGKKCPLCNKTAAVKQSVFIQKNPDIVLLECQNCHGFYASKMPYKEVLDSYYSKYYSNNDLKVTFHKAKKFASHLLKIISLRDINKEKISILDFGGGGGFLSKALAEKILKSYPKIKNIEVVVVDYERFDDINEENITVKSKKELNEVSGKYDIVIASAVLEHIPDMYGTIKKLFDFMQNGGYFYARTPYIEPFLKLSKKIEMTYPAHLHDLGDSFWNRVVDTYHLKAKILISRPSIVETGFNQNFLHALASHLFKLPGHIESKIFKSKKDMFYKYTGGWEIFLRSNKK